MPKLLVELVHLDLPVRRGRQRDPPIRMQMVNMWKRQKSMQRRIDRSSHRIVPKRTQRIHIHHLVFQIDAAIRLLERQQLIHIQRRKTCALDAPQIAPAPLHPQNLLRLSIQRIDLLQLRAGISPAKVCDPQVRTQQIRPVPQQLRCIQLRRNRLIPTIFEKPKPTLCCHVSTSVVSVKSDPDYHSTGNTNTATISNEKILALPLPKSLAYAPSANATPTTPASPFDGPHSYRAARSAP